MLSLNKSFHIKPKEISLKTHNPRKRIVTTKSNMLTSLNEFATNNQVELVSHGIIAFTCFYTSMNWYYYRRLRKEYEKKQEENKNKNNKK